jgi:hypothetical protein
VQYIAALLVFALGVACLRSSPGKIIPYLHKHARSPKDFSSGLKVAMAVRRALGLIGIVLAILLALKR